MLETIEHQKLELFIKKSLEALCAINEYTIIKHNNCSNLVSTLKKLIIKLRESILSFNIWL